VSDVQIPERAVPSISHTSRNESITVGCHVIGTRQYAPVAGLWTLCAQSASWGAPLWGNELRLRSRRKYGRHENVHVDTYKDLHPPPPVSDGFPFHTGTCAQNYFTAHIQHVYIVLIQIQNLKYMLHSTLTKLLHRLGYVFSLSNHSIRSI
jgi:hypothetical protein